MCLWAFLLSLYNLFLVLCLCGQRRWLVEFQSFWTYFCSFCCLVCGLFWKMFHVHLRRMCILLLLDVEFYKCLLHPSVLVCCSVPLCPYLFSVWRICPLEWMVCWSRLKWMHCILFPPLIVSICFTYVCAPILGTYIFIMVISSCWLTPYHYVMSFFISCYFLCFEVYFVWYKYCNTCFFLPIVCMKYLFPSLNFVCLWVWGEPLVSSV